MFDHRSATIATAGAGLLLGSDAPQIFNVPGFSVHRELGFLVAAGLSPYEALQTGTTAAAEFLGETQEAPSVLIGELGETRFRMRFT